MSFRLMDGIFTLVMFATILVYLMLCITLDSPILPVFSDATGEWVVSDEITYYLNAKGFSEGAGIFDTFTYTGDGSKLTGSGPYGIGYSTLRGAVMKIFPKPRAFLATNLVLVILAALLLFSYSKSQAATKAVMALCYPFTWIWNFTFMQESVFILISVLLALSFGSWIRYQSRSAYSLTVLTLCVVVLLRPTWIFAGVLLVVPKKEDIYINSQGLIPFSMVLLVAGFSQSMLAESLSAAEGTPAFHEVLSLLGSGDIYSAISRVYYNLLQNLFYFWTFSIGTSPLLYHALKWVPVGFVVLLATQLHPTTITRTNVASLAILFVSVLFVFLLYETYFWRETRMWTAPFYLALFLAEGKAVESFRRVLATLSVASFYLVGIDFQQKQILTRKLSVEEMKTFGNKELCLEKLRDEIPENSRVLLDFSFSRRFEMCALPLTRNSGSRIRYVLPYYKSLKKHHELTLMPGKAKLSNALVREANCFTLLKSD